jgi:hypothetical protein
MEDNRIKPYRERFAKRVSFGILEIAEGDLVHIRLGKTDIEGRFLGFNSYLNTFMIETEVEIMIIPYRSIKSISLIKRKS